MNSGFHARYGALKELPEDKDAVRWRWLRGSTRSHSEHGS